jgi:HK97 family phage major capsid protein
VKDEADQPFKTVGENLQAIVNQVRKGHVAPRMKALHEMNTKAILGNNETVPSQGQFLLEPTLVADFLKPVHEEGPFSSRVKRMPVGSNSNYGWINGVDETSRATGSRWGGVRGYWLSEGDTLTASQPKFRRINWELHKLAVLMYATDEILADTSMLNSIIAQSAAEELMFLCNDAILRGTGAGQCLGILNSAAVISAVRTNATNIDHDDILRMVARTNSRQFSNSVWFANPDIAPEIDSLNFTAGTNGILSPYVTYTADGVTMLRGRPVIYNEFSPTLGSVGDLLLADLSDYLFWEKGGVEAAASIHVQFLTDQTAFRFIYRCDGQPATYTAKTRYQSTDTESPYIALAATT